MSNRTMLEQPGTNGEQKRARLEDWELSQSWLQRRGDVTKMEHDLGVEAKNIQSLLRRILDDKECPKRWRSLRDSYYHVLKKLQPHGIVTKGRGRKGVTDDEFANAFIKAQGRKDLIAELLNVKESTVRSLHSKYCEKFDCGPLVPAPSPNAERIAELFANFENTDD